MDSPEGRLLLHAPIEACEVDVPQVISSARATRRSPFTMS